MYVCDSVCIYMYVYVDIKTHTHDSFKIFPEFLGNTKQYSHLSYVSFKTVP